MDKLSSFCFRFITFLSLAKLCCFCPDFIIIYLKDGSSDQATLPYKTLGRWEMQLREEEMAVIAHQL